MTAKFEDIDGLLTHAWSPTVEIRRDRVDGGAILRLAATLDAPLPTTVPPLWHWLAFLPEEATARLGRDGHPLRGGFLPPIDLERRMFAGAQFVFHQPIEIDEPLKRRSEVTGVRSKQGRTGTLALVTVLHRISSPRGLLLEETNDIVYLNPPESVTRRPLSATSGDRPPSPVIVRAVKPTPTMLFRFSALTFNAHRIHYDRPYTTQVEGYPDLVVQGPLLALWLAELLREQEPAPPTAFSFRAVSPAFLGDDINLAAWQDAPGHAVLTASVGGHTTTTAEAQLSV